MHIAPLFKRLFILLTALVCLAPVAVILLSLTHFDEETWTHLLEYQLFDVIKNTLYLIVGVGLGVGILGTSLAWLTATYDFPLKRFFFWALMLPLAMPAYVMAFAQLGIFDYSGGINTYFRETWGITQTLPDLRQTSGVILVMSLAFYPYVYLLARNAFLTMGKRALEAGASLGLSPYTSFFKIALPMARPWIAAGTLLALMETLADFGTVAVFNFDTFTTAIYQAWFSFYSIETAKQLASLLILGVFILLIVEQLSRGHRQFNQAGKTQDKLARKLRGGKALLAFTYCSSILLIAFTIPMLQLVIWTVETWESGFNDVLWEHTFNSVTLSLLGAFVITTTALLLSLAKRKDQNKFSTIGTRLATLGYATPGTVLAVGVFVPIAWLDNFLLAHFQFPAGTSSIFKGTLAVLILAYLTRFLAVGFSSTDAALERVSINQENAAHSLGVFGFAALRKLYLPMIKGGLGTAMLMVFVDLMKEMPITLMMRPFDWDTLAVRIFNFTSEGQYDLAAAPSLAIVLAGLIPVLLFSKMEH